MECKVCGSELKFEIEHNGGTQMYYLRCPCCGMNMPSEYTKDDCVRTYNRKTRKYD
jgi:hypothetical protein